MKISLFVPAFNEEENIKKAVDDLVACAKSITSDYEVLVVDDGSSDKTASFVEEEKRASKGVRLISHPRNLGYGEALKTGFYNSRGDYIFFTDADNQFDVFELRKFWEDRESADLLIGYRKNRADSFVRILNAWLWRILVFLLFGYYFRDIDCAFKLMNRRVIETIPRLKSSGAPISAELLIKAKRAGFRIKELPVSHFPRAYGKPTGADLEVILKALKEILILRATV